MCNVSQVCDVAVAGVRAAQQAPLHLLEGVDLHRAVSRHRHAGHHAWLLRHALERIRHFTTR